MGCSALGGTFSRLGGLVGAGHPGGLGCGLGLGALGSLILIYLAGLKLFTHADIGTRPLFFVGFFSIIMAVQFILTGVIAETLARIYFESGSSRPYEVRSPQILTADEAWHKA